MVVRIQRFYKARHRLKQRSALLLQTLMKRRCASKRVRRLLKISQGSAVLRHRLQKHKVQAAVQDWRRHSKAITVQSVFRMVVLRQKYRLTLKALA